MPVERWIGNSWQVVRNDGLTLGEGTAAGEAEWWWDWGKSRLMAGVGMRGVRVLEE